VPVWKQVTALFSESRTARNSLPKPLKVFLLNYLVYLWGPYLWGRIYGGRIYGAIFMGAVFMGPYLWDLIYAGRIYGTLFMGPYLWGHYLWGTYLWGPYLWRPCLRGALQKTSLSFPQPARILKPDKPNPLPPTNIYLISILIFSSHLCLCALSGLFQLYAEKLSTNFSSTPSLPQVPPITSFVFSREYYLLAATKREAPHYAILSCLLLRTKS